MKRPRWMWRIVLPVLASALFPISAGAQQPPSPGEPEPSPPPAAVAPPPIAPSAEVTPPPAPSTTIPPPVDSALSVAPPPPPPSAPPAYKPPINATIAARIGLELQDPNKPKNLTELHIDNSYDAVELRLSGDLNEHFSLVADFNAVLPTTAGAGTSLGIEDAIAQFKAVPELQLWLGRLLVPSDRSNFSGPFFISPWNYPGFYVAGQAPLGPKTTANGRDQGVTVWGNALGDKFKYYGGVYGIDASGPGNQPYYSGRLSYSFQGSEPGYFGSSTYYGATSVVTLGVGAQYQKACTNPGTTMANCGSSRNADFTAKDSTLFMADLLAEEATSAGTFTVEGQFYYFNEGYVFSGGPAAGPSGIVGEHLAPRASFYALLSYTTPQPIGWGKIQPMIRWQGTAASDVYGQSIPMWNIIDAGLAYVIKDYFMKVVLNYEHVDLNTGSAGMSNALQLGVQLQKF